MKFSFDSYQFDCEQQLLTKNGNIVSLNEKPAALLKLLLCEADRIHSKADILEKVWPNRVVTEQVVFQNISYLRALFGDDAIKTFSKKGYQWQLPLELVEEEIELLQPQSLVINQSENTRDTHKDTESTIESSVAEKRTNSLITWAVVTFIALLFVGYVFYTPNKNLDAPVPSSLASNENSVQVIDFSDEQSANYALNTSLTNQDLFDSPFSSWQTHAANQRQLLLAKRFYSVKDHVVLRFRIQGEERGWHDYIWAESEEIANSRLNQLITLLGQSTYFVIKSDYGALAELTVLIDKLPSDELLNQQLIKQLFKSNELDRATALVEQRLAEGPSEIREGLLNLDKTRITQWNRRWPAAEVSAAQALAIFKKLDISHLESAAWVEMSWVYLVKQDLRHSMQALNQAASKARESREPLMEINAHLIQSYMASKANQIELMHTQLDLAKEMIKLHKLDNEHMVPVYTHLGWTAGSLDNALNHYNAVLAMPFSKQYEDDFYIASQKVRDAYIEQKEWDKALDSVKLWQRDSFQQLTKSRIYLAKGDITEGVNSGIDAYQKAQIAHNKVDALDTALLLLQHKEKSGLTIPAAELVSFINQKATRRWVSQNREMLKALNIQTAVK